MTGEPFHEERDVQGGKESDEIRASGSFFGSLGTGTGENKLMKCQESEYFYRCVNFICANIDGNNAGRGAQWSYSQEWVSHF